MLLYFIIYFSLLVEYLDLLDEGGLAALPRPQQQQAHMPAQSERWIRIQVKDPDFFFIGFGFSLGVGSGF